MTRGREGLLLCLLAAGAYCAQPIFAKLAYASAVGVLTLLVIRYVVEVTLFWPLVRLLGLRLPPRSAALRMFAIGLVGISLQVFLFATALARLDAALASLLLYTFPVMVTVGAIVTGQERPAPRRFVALAIASFGVALVLGGAGGGRWDTLGVLCALGSALTYTLYILFSHRLLATSAPLTVAALGSGGAATTFLLIGGATGGLAFDFPLAGWWSALGMALVSVVAIVANLAGVRRVGPTTASIVAMTETPLTVVLAYLVLGERLLPPQLVGGALVILAIILLQRGLSAPLPEVTPAPTPMP